MILTSGTDVRPAPDAVIAEQYPVLGLWRIGRQCSGLGIRESSGPVTATLSSFVPHYFV